MRTLRRFSLPARRSFFVVGGYLHAPSSAPRSGAAQAGEPKSTHCHGRAESGAPGVTVTVTSEDTGLTRER